MHTRTHHFRTPNSLVKLVLANAYRIYFLLHGNSHSQHNATLTLRVTYTSQVDERIIED